MKNIILALVTFASLIACEEETFYIDPVHAGRYAYESPEIEFSFQLVREYGIYKGTNGRVTHPAITHSQGTDNLVVAQNRTQSGYQQIEIRSHAPVTWSVTLVGVEFVDSGMNVSEIRVKMPGAEEVVLTEQFVTK